jgi:predicted N-acetyltransferase YhbS
MIELQRATEAELPEIVALTNWAYRGTGPQSSWSMESFIEGERINEAMLREDLTAKPQAHLLVWRGEDGERLGHVWLEPTADGAWYLGMLTVRPDRQDQKLGRTLLAASEDFARGQGAERVRMTVVGQRETLIAWYQRRGYALTGETEPFPYGDDRFGRPLRDDLCFVVLERAL